MEETPKSLFTEGATEPKTYSDGTVTDPLTDITVDLADVFTTV